MRFFFFSLAAASFVGSLVAAVLSFHNTGFGFLCGALYGTGTTLGIQAKVRRDRGH